MYAIRSYYDESDVNPQTFHRMVVDHNQIEMDLESACSTPYCGIKYWRSVGTAGDVGYEEDVFLTITAGVRDPRIPV